MKDRAPRTAFKYAAIGLTALSLALLGACGKEAEIQAEKLAMEAKAAEAAVKAAALEAEARAIAIESYVYAYPLVTMALIWSVFGTALVALIGLRLPGLEFRNQRVEAAYRKELVYGEDNANRAQPPTLRGPQPSRKRPCSSTSSPTPATPS